ncbi:MAG: aspartate/glutamate racemase family protein [Chloroflexota bacterium]
MAGATLGIMLLDTSFPRIPGDVGNELSYDFPVRMKTISGATVQRVVFEADATLLEAFIEGARELETAGVAAITSSCGFLAPLQEPVARAVQVPVFLSSLMQVPLAHTTTQGRVAILTANAASLTDIVLSSAGIAPHIPLAIAGLQDVPAFREPILQDGAELRVEQVELELVALARNLLGDYPDIGSFVFECHNLAPYGRAVQSATGKPVFDIIDFATWIYGAIEKRGFPRH